MPYFKFAAVSIRKVEGVKKNPDEDKTFVDKSDGALEQFIRAAAGSVSREEV
ncbi:MAG: hypothetical protein NVS4B7_11060 [Ktedonobacteraceae bacterium]